MKSTKITEKCVFIHFAVRMFSPERELGRRDKAGAVIKSEKVQIISPKALNPLINAKNIGERACRRYGSRMDAMNAWVVPISNLTALKTELDKAVTRFEQEKTDFISKLRNHVEAQISANPADETAIRSVMPNEVDLERSIRISWVRHNLDMDDIEDYGLEREFDSIAEQAAWEIAQDVKTSTGSGTRYSQSTLDVLTRAAEKADSFGFLSESLAAIKPAIKQLKASVNAVQFTPADRLMIGAMIAFLSDHKKVANEGRHAGGVMTQPFAVCESAPAQDAPTPQVEAPPEPEQKIAVNEYSF